VALPGRPIPSPNEELIIREARRRHRRRVLTVVGIVVVVMAGVAVAVLTVTGNGSAPTHASTAPTVGPNPLASGTSVCQPGQLEVSSLGGGAGAGNVDQVFGFVNRSRSTCTVSGFPRITALNARGVPVAVAHDAPFLTGAGTGSTTPPSVTLIPGQTASATVWGTDIPVGNAAACPPGYPAFLVTAPDMTQPVKVSAVDGFGPGLFPGCSTVLRANPIVAGATGQM
jgi:hypothetical protein